MKKLLIALFLFMATNAVNARIQGVSDIVEFEVGIVDPTVGGNPFPKNPVNPPIVYYDNYTLTFETPCTGYVLRLLDEYGVEVYSTVITSSTLQLPSWLSGEYELQIIPTGSNYYFTGTISL